jgi:hypothetical protein
MAGDVCGSRIPPACKRSRKPGSISFIGLQVAVAKHLGLMTLRLADSPLLPINTTHYTLEMFRYLEGWVRSTPAIFMTHVPIHRVAAAAELTGISVDLHPVKAALHQLLSTSLALDHKKKLTLQHLRRSRPPYGRLCTGILDKLHSFIYYLFGASVSDTLG